MAHHSNGDLFIARQRAFSYRSCNLMNRSSSTLAVAIAIALASPAFPALAQSGAKTLDTVIVTGTRVADRTVAESQSPIDIITPEALQSTGTTELATALARALPSLNFP